MLGTGLVGVSVTTASAWQESRDAVSRQEAIDLVAALLWGGLSALPAVPKQSAPE